MVLKTPKPIRGSKSSIPEAPQEHTLQAVVTPIPTSKTELTNRIDLGLFDGAILEIDFTIGSLTDLQIFVEFADSDTDGDYQQQVTRNPLTTGQVEVKPAAHKFDATGKFHVSIKKAGRFMRVFMQGTGTNTSSSLVVVAVGAQDVRID